MSKINPKREAQLLHEYSILSMLLQHNMDELRRINTFNETTQQFRDNLDYNTKECESLLKTLYNIESVSNSTYIHELANKVHTVIRKNYEIK